MPALRLSGKPSRFAAAVLLLALTRAATAAVPDSNASAADEVPVEFWSLPTGSRIAFVHIAAAGATRRAPVIFVHGGPGACEVYAYAFAHPWYGHLARQGFDIYLYDQIGSGYSARLADPRQYTIGRHLADLEAIRQAIGSGQLILIGESHGASLVAGYLADHPDRVERAAFVAPGALEPAEWRNRIYPYSSPRVALEQLHWIRETSDAGAFDRYARLDALLRSGDIPAAHAFANDAEMDPLMDAFVRERILRTCVHDPARLQERQFTIPGMGWWACLMTTWDEVNHSRAVRSRLRTCRLPVLILRGDSDYLPVEIARQYVATLPNARMIAVPAAGHFIWMDQPEVYRREIETFFLGSIPPARSFTGSPDL